MTFLALRLSSFFLFGIPPSCVLLPLGSSRFHSVPLGSSRFLSVPLGPLGSSRFLSVPLGPLGPLGSSRFLSVPLGSSRFLSVLSVLTPALVMPQKFQSTRAEAGERRERFDRLRPQADGVPAETWQRAEEDWSTLDSLVSDSDGGGSRGHVVTGSRG